jgi:hypothetical protein
MAIQKKGNVPANPAFNPRDHEHARHVEHQAILAGLPSAHRGVDKAALLIGKPKTGAGQKVGVHDGMYHVTDGTMYQSISKTDMARRQDASGAAPSDPTYSPKRLAPVRTAFGQRSRTLSQEVGPGEPGARAAQGHQWSAEVADHCRKLGARVIAEALKS